MTSTPVITNFSLKRSQWLQFGSFPVSKRNKYILWQANNRRYGISFTCLVNKHAFCLQSKQARTTSCHHQNPSLQNEVMFFVCIVVSHQNCSIGVEIMVVILWQHYSSVVWKKNSSLGRDSNAAICSCLLQQFLHAVLMTNTPSWVRHICTPFHTRTCMLHIHTRIYTHTRSVSNVCTCAHTQTGFDTVAAFHR